MWLCGTRDAGVLMGKVLHLRSFSLGPGWGPAVLPLKEPGEQVGPV